MLAVPYSITRQINTDTYLPLIQVLIDKGYGDEVWIVNSVFIFQHSIEITIAVIVCSIPIAFVFRKYTFPAIEPRMFVAGFIPVFYALHKYISGPAFTGVESERIYYCVLPAVLFLLVANKILSPGKSHKNVDGLKRSH